MPRLSQSSMRHLSRGKLYAQFRLGRLGQSRPRLVRLIWINLYTDDTPAAAPACVCPSRRAAIAARCLVLKSLMSSNVVFLGEWVNQGESNSIPNPNEERSGK